MIIYSRCRGVNIYVLYPWIHQCDNNLKTEHQTQCISFPDINPAKELPQNAHISMAAGDFLQVYLCCIHILQITFYLFTL